MTAKAELPEVSSPFYSPHEVIKGDARVDGPYLDDIRQAEEDETRRRRMEGAKALASQKKASNLGSEEEALKSEEEKSPAERLAWHKANLSNPNAIHELNPLAVPEVVAREHFAADTYREKDEQDPLIANTATPITVNKRRDTSFRRKYDKDLAEGNVDFPGEPSRTKKKKADPSDLADVVPATGKKAVAKKGAKKAAAVKKVATPKKKTSELPRKTAVSKARKEAKKREPNVKSTVVATPTATPPDAPTSVG